jgi:8-amino-7-oxononanoate synthase
VTPVVPIVVGEQATNFRFWRRLTDSGLFVSPVTKPAVEKDLVRAVFMATHTDQQVDRALDIFQRCGREVGIIPYERPHTRVEVKMARPGATGFYSSADGGETRAIEANRGVELGDVLLHSHEPLRQRLSDAAEILTWRAINASPDDLKKLADLPEKLWTQRHRIRNKLLSMGMEYVARRARGRNGGDQVEETRT